MLDAVLRRLNGNVLVVAVAIILVTAGFVLVPDGSET